MMMTYQEDLDEAVKELENSDQVPEILNRENVDPDEVVYHGDLKKKFSLIILDSPPAGIVSDVGVLANKVDSIFLVIRVGLTKIRTVKQVVRTIKDLGGNIQGSILSRINPKRERYYYYHHYPHYYSSYYRDRDNEEDDTDEL
jgi:Mrp family chromosome partitioning ATPase